MQNQTSSRARRRAHLAEYFDRASVGLKLLDGPISPGALDTRDIFQLDVHESPTFGEYVRIWPGAAANEIEAIAIDRGHRQVLLRVKEARRRFVQRIWRAGRSDAELAASVRAAGGRVLAELSELIVAELWTPEEERRYLCGKDDVKLFVAQVSGGSTIAEAHAALRPRVVAEAEARQPGSVVRQGEWFFVPPTPEHRARLEASVGDDPRLVRHAQPVGAFPGGRPHVADDVVRLPRAGRPDLVFARGVVRHVDHRPLAVPAFRRVVRNRAVESKESALRLRWID